MASEIQKVLSVAEAEIGYLEKATNDQLDDKTANAGNNNFTKYARDLDNIPGFYNGKKNGYPWCDVFVDSCFVKAFGVARAKVLLNHSDCGAGCEYSAGYFKDAGRWYTSPLPGDQIFFLNSAGEYCHTGIVYDVSGGTITTIEGNTSKASGVIPNGGGVAKKTYQVGYSMIAGFGRPRYSDYDSSGGNSTETNNSTTSGVKRTSYKKGYVYEIPLDMIDRVEYCPMAGSKGERVSSAAKRIKWNGRSPDIICNCELFNMTSYKPASAVVDEGQVQLLNGTSGFAFVDHKTPVFTYNNGINGVDFVGGYPVLVCNGKQYFTKDPAGLGGYRGRTALGLNEKNFSFIFVPEQAGSADAELTDVASTFISMGYTYAIGLDGGGSTSYQTPDAGYEQGRAVRGFVCLWYAGGKGNRLSPNQTSSSSASQPITPSAPSSPSSDKKSKVVLQHDASAAKGIRYTVKVNGTLNARNADGSIKQKLANGATVMYYGYNTSTSFQNFKPGKWFYIQISPGNNAYVCAQYLVKQG